MTLFDDSRHEMAAVVLDVFGVDATYTFKDTSTKDIKVRVYKNVDVMRDGDFVTIATLIGIPEIDVPNPVRGEVVTVSDQAYEVGRLINREGGLARYEST